jgi:hypothetical protein
MVILLDECVLVGAAGPDSAVDFIKRLRAVLRVPKETIIVEWMVSNAEDAFVNAAFPGRRIGGLRGLACQVRG